MLKRIHPIAGIIAFLTILTFWTSTVVSELFGSVETITFVKQAIPWGFLILCASTGNHRSIRVPASRHFV
jgi:hypothetical protein